MNQKNCITFVKKMYHSHPHATLTSAIIATAQIILAIKVYTGWGGFVTALSLLLNVAIIAAAVACIYLIREYIQEDWARDKQTMYKVIAVSKFIAIPATTAVIYILKAALKTTEKEYRAITPLFQRMSSAFIRGFVHLKNSRIVQRTLPQQ